MFVFQASPSDTQTFNTPSPKFFLKNHLHLRHKRTHSYPAINGICEIHGPDLCQRTQQQQKPSSKMSSSRSNNCSSSSNIKSNTK